MVSSLVAPDEMPIPSSMSFSGIGPDGVYRTPPSVIDFLKSEGALDAPVAPEAPDLNAIFANPPLAIREATAEGEV